MYGIVYEGLMFLFKPQAADSIILVLELVVLEIVRKVRPNEVASTAGCRCSFSPPQFYFFSSRESADAERWFSNGESSPLDWSGGGNFRQSCR